MRKNILKRLIDNLSGADLRRVRKDPMEIMGMEHPSEAAQLYVVRQNPEMIQFIGAPSEKVQLEAVRKDTGVFLYINKPTEKVKSEVLKSDCGQIIYMDNPSGNLQMQAVESDCGSIIFIVFAIMWGINGWAQSMGSPPSIVTLSRWFPLRIRGTYYGFFSASHNIGEGLSFIFVGSIVAAFGWKWGFFGAACAGLLGVLLILFWLHDTPESKGLPSIEELSGEETKKPAAQESAESAEARAAETRKIQKAVLRNSGVWILALSSAFMYMSRYAINEWGTIFLQETYEYDLKAAAAIIGINPIFGVLGTVFSGWLSDKVFKGDRKYPAFTAGVLEAISLYLFLFGNGSHFTLILSMVLFGIAIGVLISFLGGLMAIDLVPRKASGAALGIVGVASYAAAGLQNVVTGLLLDNNTVEVVNKLGETVTKHDFTYVSWFWLGAAVISFLLPMLNWRRKRQEI